MHGQIFTLFVLGVITCILEQGLLPLISNDCGQIVPYSVWLIRAFFFGLFISHPPLSSGWVVTSLLSWLSRTFFFGFLGSRLPLSLC